MPYASCEAYAKNLYDMQSEVKERHGYKSENTGLFRGALKSGDPT